MGTMLTKAIMDCLTQRYRRKSATSFLWSVHQPIGSLKQDEKQEGEELCTKLLKATPPSCYVWQPIGLLEQDELQTAHFLRTQEGKELCTTILELTSTLEDYKDKVTFQISQMMQTFGVPKEVVAVIQDYSFYKTESLKDKGLSVFKTAFLCYLTKPHMSCLTRQNRKMVTYQECFNKASTISECKFDALEWLVLFHVFGYNAWGVQRHIKKNIKNEISSLQAHFDYVQNTTINQVPHCDQADEGFARMLCHVLSSILSLVRLESCQGNFQGIWRVTNGKSFVLRTHTEITGVDELLEPLEGMYSWTLRHIEDVRKHLHEFKIQVVQWETRLITTHKSAFNELKLAWK
jgi:hypothetical protein